MDPTSSVVLRVPPSPPRYNGELIILLQRPAANGNPNSPPLMTTKTISTLLQVMAAFLVAGFGNVGAGLILDHVKEWPVFLNVNELFILVPSLLGLKGNLEMTMASRLSTQANLGHMDNPHELLKMAKGNLALVQCQATVVSFVVAIFASYVKSFSQPNGGIGASELIESTGGLGAGVGGPFNQLFQQPASINFNHQNNNATNATLFLETSIGSEITNNNNHLQNMISGAEQSMAADPQAAAAATGRGFHWEHALILCASSLLTANIACFVLGTMMILVIVGSHRCNIDPDNIAAPVAASLGDMTTAALLAVIAHSIYHYSQQQRMPYLALVITLLFLAMLPIWIGVARSNPYTSDVITRGWTPIVIAVFISSCGGFILEHGKTRFSRLPVFQPVVNGVGGNLVAVQASRLSTSLHRNGKPGQLPGNFKLLTGPLELFFGRKRTYQTDINLTTARLLLLMSIPAHVLYFFVIRFIEGESSAPVTVLFLGLYMLFAVLQVSLSRQKSWINNDFHSSSSSSCVVFGDYHDAFQTST